MAQPSMSLESPNHGGGPSNSPVLAQSPTVNQEQLLLELPHIRKLFTNIEQALDSDDLSALTTLFSFNTPSVIVDCVQLLSFHHCVKSVVFLCNLLNSYISEQLSMSSTPSDTHSQTVSVGGVCDWLRVFLAVRGQELKNSVEAVSALAKFQQSMIAISQRYKKALQLKGKLDYLVGKIQLVEL